MNKVYIAIMCMGLLMSGYYGFQWWQSSQAVETVSLAESETWSEPEATMDEDPVSQPPSAEEKGEEPATMSNEVDTYQTGNDVGRLVIPGIEKGYTTYWGADDATLEQGVGMYVSEWTTTPDQKRHTVLSGHRDTVFTELGEVEAGDSLFMEFEGNRYEYVVQDLWVTEADDRTVIVDKDEATLTLTTCYPLDYIGNAPDRYIIQSELVNVREM
ncbi:class D sortase [Shouchella shacheensis]|uniref:class D sortase n=1 Tax=Shouchella shacheensis TaxID=1649580 RepID=UPI0007404B67|nr:class D sortase [Shouchella shacheensis]